MKKNIQIGLGSLFLVLGSIFTACGPDARLDMVGMFAGSSPTIDKRFEQSMEYNQQAGYATIQAPSENYHVYVCTDTHIHQTRKRWEHFINAYRGDKLCPLAVHLGDIIDTNITLLSEWLMILVTSFSELSGRIGMAMRPKGAVA